MHIWIVEILNVNTEQWEPTAGAYLSRSFAREQKKYDWEFNNPHDRFRIKRYIPALSRVELRNFIKQEPK